jgi:RNA polymerase sigma-70 factor (ECF subfamily)
MDLLGLALFTHSLRAKARALRPRMYKVAYAWTHDAALADDLVQEALTKALERLSQVREPDRLEAWVFRILTNCWRDTLRARVDMDDFDEIAAELPGSDLDPEQHHSRLQTAARVRAAVERLPYGQREVVTLVDLCEFSYGETASILEVPVGTVMSRLCRARAALRMLLRKEAPGGVIQLPAKKRIAS